MATGGQVPGQNSDRAWSEGLDNLKCQPCLEDGHLHEAVGMCLDCDDYLCSKCYQGHTLQRPMRYHQLLDIEEMRRGKIRATTKDSCNENCLVHDGEIIRYYCINHHKFGCTLCVTSDHKTCEEVHYIPHVAKELASNEEYMQAKERLKSTIGILKTESESITQNQKELEINLSEAVSNMKEFRRKLDEALANIEAELIENVEALKSEQRNDFEEIRDKYRAAEEELQAAWTKIETLLNSQQNCGVYINMMKSHEHVEDIESLIEQATSDISSKKHTIRFSPNKDTLEMLQFSDAFGTVPGIKSEAPEHLKPSENGITEAESVRERIKRLNHLRDLNVKCHADRNLCSITGLVFISNDRLILADNRNPSLKEVCIHSGRVLYTLKMPCAPWDVTALSINTVAVTLPAEKKVVIITVTDYAMSPDKTLEVDGQCYGVDYRNNMLAVSLRDPDKVLVLNLQGTVLHTLSADILGNPFFNDPFYLSYGQDETTLYVSNNENLTSVKLGGTVVAKFTNNDPSWCPQQPLVDNNGDVLVCAGESVLASAMGLLTDKRAVHQITGDCKKVRVLLTKTDFLKAPRSICFNTKKDTIFVGMCSSDIVKVYSVERGAH